MYQCSRSELSEIEDSPAKNRGRVFGNVDWEDLDLS